MIDQELLSILACPENKQSLSIASDDLIERLNQAIDRGELKNRGGNKIEEKIQGGLIREDQHYLYPIREDIPIMLIDEAIGLESLG